MGPVLGRWYAFGPWLLVLVLIWRSQGWRRALAVAAGGWLIAFAAEWASTAGPGGPFGSYSYRGGGLDHDWRVLGVPVFDTVSFTWLGYLVFALAGRARVRGWRRTVLGAVALVAIDGVVDPVALRGAHWWLGSIYSYPAGTGVWYGVSALNYLGWLVVGGAVLLWLRAVLGEGGGSGPLARWVSGVVLLAVMAQSTALAWWLGVGPSSLAALGLLGLVLVVSQLSTPALPDLSPALIVACALETEARAVRRAWGGDWLARHTPATCRWWCPGAPFEVWTSGLGPGAARAAAAEVPPGVTVLVAGLSGACHAGWAAGDLALGACVLDPDDRWTAVPPPPPRVRQALDSLRRANLATRSSPVSSVSGLADLASQGVDLVDTESSSWATELQGDLTLVRVVLDTPQSLLGPAAELVPVGARSVEVRALLSLLARHPGALRQLLRLGRVSGRCLPQLGQAVVRIAPALAASAAPTAARSASGPADVSSPA